MYSRMPKTLLKSLALKGLGAHTLPASYPDVPRLPKWLRMLYTMLLSNLVPADASPPGTSDECSHNEPRGL
jgi:hypothetical protein